MALFAIDYESKLLREYFQKSGLCGEALDEAVRAAKEEMEKGRPLAYIIQEQAFYDLVLYVDERVLIPRPDTERLVETVLRFLPKNARFLDLGTGSGCIPVTLLKHRPDAVGTALDLSPDALIVAKKNADMVGVADRLTFCEGDMTKNPFAGELFDAIISNPPYIPREDIPKYPSLSYEPQMALDGGIDGMDFYRAILSLYRDNLKAGGGFFFEIGFDQGKAMRALAETLGYTCEIYKDYGKNDRVAVLFLNDKGDLP
ncbi:MAG: peptide chain release factor N(5)-glutamine methyltransferase [Clostridia bacterium]|nr:peptide chain release factor N(5)-glutamine methyltransferase [Clostridia bacterium]